MQAENDFDVTNVEPVDRELSLSTDGHKAKSQMIPRSKSEKRELPPVGRFAYSAKQMALCYVFAGHPFGCGSRHSMAMSNTSGHSRGAILIGAGETKVFADVVQKNQVGLKRDTRPAALEDPGG